MRFFHAFLLKKTTYGFAIVAIYIDLNLIDAPEELIKTTSYLKNEFEMKDLEKIKFCFSLQIEYLLNGIFVHQLTYIEKVINHFYMDNAHHLSTRMIVLSLNTKKDLF